jgi:hypothetical protein
MMERREALNIVREYSSGPVSSYRLLKAYSQKCREAESLLEKGVAASHFRLSLTLLSCWLAGKDNDARTGRLVSTSLIVVVALPSLKERLPLPTTTGVTQILYSSIRSWRISMCISSALPYSRRSSHDHCFSLETSSATFPLIRLELFHSAPSRVVEATYLGRLFILSATSSPVLKGQAAAKPW